MNWLTRLFGRKEPQPVILGAQLARAAAADAEHRRQFAGPSPMPAGVYDDLTLIDPRPLPLDDDLRRLCNDFKARPAGLRNALTMDDFYLLMHFARRAAVFALRGKSPQWIEDGLTAVAIADDARVDLRDLFIPLSLLHHAALRIGADANALFDRAAALATRNVGQAIRGFGRRTEHDRDIRLSWGHDEIVTSNGVGFIERDFHQTYRPTRDLVALALAIRERLERDAYRVESVTIATSLPPVWFKSPKAAALLAGANGTVSIHARHRSDGAQIVMAWIVELDSPRTAEELASLAAKAASDDVALVTATDGSVLTLLVGRSYIAEVASVENIASMKRFL